MGCLGVDDDLVWALAGRRGSAPDVCLRTEGRDLGGHDGGRENGGGGHSGAEGLTQRRRAPPAKAPASIASTGTARRRRILDVLVSATRPVTVKVSTVVVRSGTASLRATAFWPPMATARRATRTSRVTEPVT